MYRLAKNGRLNVMQRRLANVSRKLPPVVAVTYRVLPVEVKYQSIHHGRESFALCRRRRRL